MTSDIDDLEDVADLTKPNLDHGTDRQIAAGLRTNAAMRERARIANQRLDRMRLSAEPPTLPRLKFMGDA